MRHASDTRKKPAFTWLWGAVRGASHTHFMCKHLLFCLFMHRWIPRREAAERKQPFDKDKQMSQSPVWWLNAEQHKLLVSFSQITSSFKQYRSSHTESEIFIYLKEFVTHRNPARWVQCVLINPLWKKFTKQWKKKKKGVFKQRGWFCCPLSS